MIEVLSKSRSKTKPSKKKALYSYWKLIYPIDYVKKLVSESLIRIASDSRDVMLNGKLKQTRDGFVFVDVSNSIFDGILPLISDIDTGIEQPSKDEKNSDNIGAHITVIKKKEVSSNNIDFQEEGMEVSYKITGLKEVEPDGWPEMEKVWFLEIKSPEIEDIRKRYGLSPKIKDHEFHITIGVKKR